MRAQRAKHKESGHSYLLPRPSATPSETEGEFPAPAAPCRRLKRNADESLGLEDVVMRGTTHNSGCKIRSCGIPAAEKGDTKRDLDEMRSDEFAGSKRRRFKVQLDLRIQCFT